MAEIDAILEALADELRRTRENLGLTRDAVSALLNQRASAAVEARTIASYEHHTRDLSVRRLLELAISLEVPANELLGKAMLRASPPSGCPSCGRDTSHG